MIITLYPLGVAELRYSRITTTTPGTGMSISQTSQRRPGLEMGGFGDSAGLEVHGLGVSGLGTRGLGFEPSTP